MPEEEYHYPETEHHHTRGQIWAGLLTTLTILISGGALVTCEFIHQQGRTERLELKEKYKIEKQTLKDQAKEKCRAEGRRFCWLTH